MPMPRMHILTPAEHVKFDTPPHFHSVERKRFFDISQSLDPLLASFRTPTNQMCFVLTLGYFRATKRQQFPLFSLLPLSPSQQNSLTVVDGFIKVKSG